MPLNLQALINNGLLDELAARINTPVESSLLLAAIDFPNAHRPNFARADSPIDYWFKVCEQIEGGRVTGGFEPLLRAAARRLPGNQVFAPFANPAPSVTPPSGVPGKRDPAHAHLTARYYDVFISYSRRDETQVKFVAQGLRRRGVRVWLDEWEIPLGVPFADDLQQVLGQVKVVLVCIGDGGLGPWQSAEVRVALERSVRNECRLIPLLLPGVAGMEALPLFLRTLNGMQFKTTGDEGALDKLAEAILR